MPHLLRFIHSDLDVVHQRPALPRHLQDLHVLRLRYVQPAELLADSEHLTLDGRRRSLHLQQRRTTMSLAPSRRAYPAVETCGSPFAPEPAAPAPPSAPHPAVSAGRLSLGPALPAPARARCPLRLGRAKLPTTVQRQERASALVVQSIWPSWLADHRTLSCQVGRLGAACSNCSWMFIARALLSRI